MRGHSVRGLWELIFGRHIRVVCETGDDTEPPFGFLQVQAIDFQGWSGDRTSSAFGNLLASLQHFIVGDALGPAPIERTAVRARRVAERWWVASIVAVVVLAGAAALFINPGLGLRSTD